MEKYELLDQALEQFTPVELATYIWINYMDYSIELYEALAQEELIQYTKDK
jgi:hypothetical protein